MANDEHINILFKGVDVWNKWYDEVMIETQSRLPVGDDVLYRKILREIQPDLSNADLRNERLNGINLVEVNLQNAQLEGAHLVRANLNGANLVDVNLSNAELGLSDIFRTNLTNANLRNASLFGANIYDAILTNADMTNAKVGWTSFANLNLDNVKGLETIIHQVPSSIGIDTIYRSQGKIPEVFLRGVGVPNSFITFVSSLTSQAIQYYSCFISYSSMDQEFAERLHSDLQDMGVRCWFAPEDVKGGRKLLEQIPEAIRLSDKLLLVLSKHSMDSEWVKTEIYHARQDEIHDNKRKLFPIGLVDFDIISEWKAFDADIGKDMAREVREYFIPDFSNWQDRDAYKKAFDRLLRDLKASEQ
jgi:uncharacterized protein YjbI with pentapeptide repeats